MKSREESRQRGYIFVGEAALREERGERCIVTDEMELWQKEAGRLQRETGEDQVFLSHLLYMQRLSLSSPPSF